MSSSAGETVPEGTDPPSRARYMLAFGIWLLGGAVAIASYGIPDDLDPVSLVFLGLWATFHFALVSIAVLVQSVGPLAVVVATLVALVALLVVPRAVQASVERDPSSTAALIHIYDPLLMTLPVAAVLGVSWLVRRSRKSTTSDAA